MGINDLTTHYRYLLQQHGDSPEAVQHSSQESQEARFRILSEIADLNGKRVLDFGCGTAHFASYLKELDIDCTYVGVDIVPEFLDIAKAKHPAHSFGDWSDFMDEEFDFAFASGVFNNKMIDNKSFYESTLTALFERVRGGVAFNMMSTYVDFQVDELFYASPEEIFAFAKSLTPYVTLRHDYLVKAKSVPFEFAIYAYRQATSTPNSPA